MLEMTHHPKTPRDNSTSTEVTKPKEIEIQQQQMPVVNLVTPVAQAIEIAKSEIERKRNENGNDSMHTSVVGDQQQRKKYRKKPPVDWNSFRY